MIPKPSKIETLKTNFVKKFKTIDKRIIMFLIFVAISGMLWLMNALSKDYITDVDCPITYRNIPDDYVFIGNTPKSVKLQISGRGFTLLKYAIGSIALPYNIDLQSYFSGNEQEQPSIEFSYYITSNKEQIQRFLNDEITVLDVSPTILRLNFDRLHSKKVKVSPLTQFTLAPQYRQKGSLKTKPDSVLVKGPKSIIDTLKQVYTAIIKDNNIKENKVYQTNLTAPSQCNISVTKATVMLNTEQFTENTIEIPIQIINQPDSTKLTIFPNTVNVTFVVSFDNYEKITSNDFKAAIDYQDIKQQSTPQELKINLLFVPIETKLVRYWPQEARFIVNTK